MYRRRLCLQLQLRVLFPSLQRAHISHLHPGYSEIKRRIMPLHLQLDNDIAYSLFFYCKERRQICVRAAITPGCLHEISFILKGLNSADSVVGYYLPSGGDTRCYKLHKKNDNNLQADTAQKKSIQLLLLLSLLLFVTVLTACA